MLQYRVVNGSADGRTKLDGGDDGGGEFHHVQCGCIEEEPQPQTFCG